MDEDEQELFHLAEEERSLLELEHRKLSAHDNHVDAWSQFDDEFAERLLIEEMRKLPFEEQENVMFDVHGILHDIDQADPPDVEKRLEEMEMELHKIRRKKAYERAMYWDEEYVNDRSFRLRFLRCDRYRSQVAAQRIVRHFQVKQEHFGDGPQLARDIKLADLSPLDVVALESGFIQVLPVQDGAGRTVVSIATMHCPHACSIENCIRAMWYMFYAVMQDEEAQRMGVVSVKSNYGVKARCESFSCVKQIYRLCSGLPKKVVGFHYCYDNASLKPIVQGVRLFLAKDMRTRFRTHFGHHDRIMFELRTFGIPTEYHPIQPNGDLSLEWHKVWLDTRRVNEESESSQHNMILPRRFDVLFGRGKYCREHTGNRRALHLVEMHRAEYEKAGKLEKTAIADRIVRIIHESLGRFLKWENRGWVEVDSLVGREKITHYFRHLRSKTMIRESTDETGQVEALPTTAEDN